MTIHDKVKSSSQLVEDKRMLLYERRTFHPLQVLNANELESGMVVIARHQAAPSSDRVMVIVSVDERGAKILSLPGERIYPEELPFCDMGIEAYPGGKWSANNWVGKHPEGRKLSELQLLALLTGDSAMLETFDKAAFSEVASEVPPLTEIVGSTKSLTPPASTTKMYVWIE